MVVEATGSVYSYTKLSFDLKEAGYT